MSRQMHLLAVAFRASISRTCPQVQFSFKAYGADDFGLIVQVTRLEPTRYNPDFIEHGPAAGRPLFSPEGERLWEWLWATGCKVRDQLAPGQALALIHAAELPDAEACEALVKVAA